MSRACATPTSTVFPGNHADLGDAPALGARDVELVAVQVHRVVVHAQVDHADAHALALLDDHAAWSRAPTLPLIVSQLNSIASVFGTVLLGSMRPLLEDEAEVFMARRGW